MLWNDEDIKQQAHKLALQHDPFMKRKSSERLWSILQSEMDMLRGFVRQLNESCSSCSQPAEEWLMDHAEFLEAEMLEIKDKRFLKQTKSMPYISKTNELRVSAICSNYLEHTDGVFDEETFVKFLRSYQEVSVLTVAEAWSLPLFMKVELIRRLAGMMGMIRERRDICTLVEKVLDGIRPSELTPERLKESLEHAGCELPLSGAMIVHLVQHLREHAETSAHVAEWLICKLENGPQSLDSILSYEFQLQASYEVSTGNMITSLRKLSRLRWSEWFEKISLVEQTLRKEEAGDYPKMDDGSRDLLRKRVERLARRMKVPENLVAEQAVALANESFAKSAVEGDEIGPPYPRSANIAYYLLEAEGLIALREALKMCGKTGAMPEARLLKRATQTYFQTLGLFFFVALLAAAWWIGADAAFAPWQWALVLSLSALPMSEWAVAGVHWLIERTRRPARLLRYDFSQGVPSEAATMVVIPVIWSTVEEVKGIGDRLELHFLANRDPNIHFAILADFKDSEAEEQPQDKMVLKAAEEEVSRLNKAYSGRTTFHLFHRKRVWNDSEQCWMGWERKRGKLSEFVELLQGSRSTSFYTVAGDTSVLPTIRYIITLDADTQLPLESARRMIGALHLPYNRPRLNESGTKVVEGYGVLQPRIGMSHESVRQSRLAALWSGDPGIDPYAFAVSDPYQDGMGEGIFTGKGIFDVKTFYRVLCDRIPENRVLSHDLLEGGFLRAGLLTDIELIDDHPATFLAYQKRLHRWIRGDWQLIPWLLPKGKNRKGELVPIDLSALTRWQMIDNLRRSLLFPALTAVMVSAPLLPGPALRWYGLALATLFLPFLRQCVSLNAVWYRPRYLLASLGHVLLAFATLPFQTVFIADAIFKSLYRLTVSKRRLLEWVSQAEVERASRRQGGPKLGGLYAGYGLTLATAIFALWRGEPAVQILGVAVGAVWASVIWIVDWLDQPLREKRADFNAEETAELRLLARDIWEFYDDYVTERDNWLPPDNVQLDPDRGAAHRTSPTNIGLYLACVLAARDFGFIDTPDMIERLTQTVDTIERMEKWEGHLYNWYNTETLEPLHPVYVSTVDSGNLAACLMAVREGVVEWIRTDLERGKVSPRDSVPSEGDAFQVAFAEELFPQGGRGTSFGGDRGHGGNVKERGLRLARRIDALVQGTDFRPLYDNKENLFSIGYQVSRRERDNVLYDLLASEARQASFVAIALGQVSVSHWNALGRTMTISGKQPLLLSWSGTMFEYLMPWLLMRTYRGSVWDATYRAVVGRQIQYAVQRDVPFGISESGFYAFDHQMNYQYRAFGVPGLGFKRGLEEDLVLAPYATILALPYAERESFKALKRMESIGARGRYGYYEAIDFTPERMPEGRKYMVVKSFMAHHQGMSLLTLSNLLSERSMVERFHRHKSVRAAELLLQERVPLKPALIKHPALQRIHEPHGRQERHPSEVREFASGLTRIPEACVLSNGTFTTIITNSGSGFSQFEGKHLSRWREEPVRDPWGNYVFIREMGSDNVWSLTEKPCGKAADRQLISFELERAVFERVDGAIRTLMEVCVSPEADAELRRITVENNGEETKMLEITTYVELSLDDPLAELSHPAFSKLFIRTMVDDASGCLLAARRPRNPKEKVLWAAHLLSAEEEGGGSPEYETDRSAFVGRGFSLSEPQSIRKRLSGKTGSVADPVFVMRRRIRVEPGNTAELYAVTAAAYSREEAVRAALRLANRREAERSFQMSWNRTRIELRNLHLEHREAVVFQRFAGRVLYTPPLKQERIRSILDNWKGQSGLWAFGISGDRPVVLVTVDHRSHLSFVMKVITGHEYLRRLGLMFDLVIINESEDGYYQDLQDTLRRAVEYGVDRFGAGVAGIHVIAASSLSEEDRTLLAATARISLDAGGPSLTTQLRIPGEEEVNELPPKIHLAAGERNKRRVSFAPGLGKDWQFFNGWGGFSSGGKEYRIVLKPGDRPPAPWSNVLANPRFGCLVTELGTGFTWWRNSRECKLTPWSNDPVLDPPMETGFIRDEESGDVWTLAPSRDHGDPPYGVVHGWGYTHFEHVRHDIRHTATVFVPMEDEVKLIRVRLHNEGEGTRSLSLTYYAEWVIGVHRTTNAPYVVTEWDSSAKVLTASNRYQETFREAIAFLGVYGGDGSAPEDGGLSWTGDQLEFVGRGGSLEQPEGLERERLSCRAGVFHASCGAVQRKLSLAPGEIRELVIVLGCADSPETVKATAQKFSTAAACEQAYKETVEFWERALGQTVVETPSLEMDFLLNGWLLYQTIACRMWGRSGFYQSGGAYGYRDQLQDSLSVLHTMPELTRAQLLIHAAHQYEEGDVQHWWHEETERGIRTLFSDDLLWLPYVAARYVEHTGDLFVWEETAPYLTSERLGEGEHERYEETRRSGNSGTLYEHCLRAIDRALQHIGEHGLPLIGSGDWNDGFSHVGPEGRGESVWLAWFLCDVLRRFETVCEERGDEERAGTYRAARERFAESARKHGWDGQWYRRAFTDAGTWLGTIETEECRIDAIAQSWSVISGAAPKHRALEAMFSFDRELVDKDLGVAKLLTPAFERTDPSPGYIQGYPPGVRENGAQYTHGVIWSIIAWSMLGQGDKAFELFHMLNPVTHTNTNREARRYMGEPYVMAADVYTAEPHYGRAGWTWYTGAAGWMYQAGLEWILGLQRRGERLYLNPCLPSDWPGFKAVYRFGDAKYIITVTQTPGSERSVPALTVDGETAVYRKEEGADPVYILLADDGMEHQVELTL